jgi:hypothetical protein
MAIAVTSPKNLCDVSSRKNFITRSKTGGSGTNIRSSAIASNHNIAAIRGRYVNNSRGIFLI